MTKKFNPLVTWSCYKYAPESFRLFIDNTEINLDSETKDKLFSFAIAGNDKSIMDEAKRIMRKEAKKETRKKIIGYNKKRTRKGILCNNRLYNSKSL